MVVVTLIGDSILDNYKNLQGPDLTQTLTNLKHKVKNYAIDGCTTTDILNGLVPNEHTRSYAYPTDLSNMLRPLQNINTTGFNVLSVGGNDIKTHVMSLISGVDVFWKEVDPILKKYKSIVSKIVSQNPRLILIIYPYPCKVDNMILNMVWDSTVAAMEKWRTYLIELATDNNLPIIDLSMTLNYEDTSSYGPNKIDLSDKANEVLAKLIDYVITNHKFTTVKIYKHKL